MILAGSKIIVLGGPAMLIGLGGGISRVRKDVREGINTILHLPSNRVFLICGILSIFGTGVLLWCMRTLITDPSIRQAGKET